MDSSLKNKTQWKIKNNAGLHRSLALCDFDDLIANNLMKREAALASISDASRSPVFVLFLRHNHTPTLITS